jgi:DnaJ-class molecular chaperone
MLLKKAADLKQKNYFDMLGISRTASAGDVKRAYFALAKEYHPDRLPASVSREVRKVAEELFQYLTTAQEVLSDTKRREAYVRELSTGVKAGMSDEVTRILAAEGQFQQGETYLRRRMFAKAAECFKEAINLYADEGEFHAHYGWALFQSDPENRDIQKQAREAINAAISLNPKIDRAYLFLGYIHKSTGRQDLAEQQFEKAIQCNPDCTDALRELRLLDMRRGGPKPGVPPRR